MESDSQLYIRTLERKLQQSFTAPWVEPRELRELKSLVTELSDQLMQALTEYIRENTQKNLALIVVLCTKLKALGYHPTIIGEKKIPNGIQIFRADIWAKIQEVENGNPAVSNDPI